MSRERPVSPAPTLGSRRAAGRRADGGVHLVAIAVIASAVLIAFLPALSSDFVIWDDDLNFTDNPRYRGLGPAQLRWMLTTILGGHYHPLTWMTLGLDYTLWGMDARGYHLTSLLLHAATAVCCYFLVLELIRVAPSADRRRHASVDRAAAVAGALFFAIHPLRVESVAWVSERRDVLSGLFFLLTILGYVRARTAALAATGRAWSRASLACFVLSLLSKAWGMTLPVVLLVIDLYPLRRLERGESLRALVREKLSYALLALAAAMIAFLAQARTPEMRSIAQHGLAARLAQAAYGLAFYVRKTILPLRLSPAYLLETPLDPTAPRFVVSALAVLVVAAAVFAWRRRAPWALAACAAYAVIVSPVLGLAQAGPQLVADRYTYLSTIPFAVLVAAAIAATATRRMRLVATISLTTLIALGTLTFHQTRIWHDSMTLWNHTIRLDPSNYIAYTNRGWAQQLAGDLDAAVADYGRAIAANPRYALAYYDRGTVRDDRGDLEGAADDYSEVIELDPSDARALNNRGYVRQRQGDLTGALVDYARALLIAPPGWPHRPLVERNLDAARRALARETAQ